MRKLIWVALLALCAAGCVKFGAAATKTVVALDLAVKTAAKDAVECRLAEIKALTGEAVAKAKELGCPGTDDAVKAKCAEALADLKEKRAEADARWEKARTALLVAAGSVYAAAVGVKAYLDGAQSKPDIASLISDAIKLYGALRALLEDLGVKSLPEIPWTS